MTLEEIDRALATLASIDPEMSVSRARLLTAIARQPGEPVVELGAALGMTQPSTSRNAAALGDVHRLGSVGYELIELTAPKPRDQRLRYALSAKGKRLFAKITKGE